MGMRNVREPSGDGATLSRRGFLGASGTFGAAALAPGRTRALVETLVGDERADVVVVGGGLAGLSAARVLHGAGVDMLVLEQSPQAGGRANLEELPESPAALVLESHRAVLALAQSVGLRTRPAEIDGDAVITLAGTRRVVAAGSLCGAPDIDREVGVALEHLNLMGVEVDPAAPWAASNASVRDAVTLGAWANDNVGTGAGRALVALIARAVWAAEPSEISLLHALATIAGAGGVGPLVNATLAPNWRGPELAASDGSGGGISCRTCRDGSQLWRSVPRAGEPVRQMRVDGGSTAVVNGLMRALGGRVRSAAPVRRIQQDDHGVSIAGDGFAVRAARAVVALPPLAVAQIAFEPGLSAEQRSLLRISGGDAFTVVVTYPTAFWREGGLSGWGASSSGALTLARGDRSGGEGVLVASARGPAAQALAAAGRDERRRLVESAVATWFGTPVPSASQLSELDGRGGGGWSVVVPPGTVTSTLRGIREAHGRIFWAGTERSSRWAGWLEGAVHSGEAAARQVLGTSAAESTPAEELVL